jgi:Amt family ammonium transporter
MEDSRGKPHKFGVRIGRNWKAWVRQGVLLGTVLSVSALTQAADGDQAPTAMEVAQAATDGVNYVWTLVAAFLVFFMQAGFAMVESGFTRAKNAVNILMKNLMDFSVGSLAFWAIGFGLMFGATYKGFFGTTGFFMSGVEESHGSWGYAFLIFQTVFAATAATIVSGALAERTKFVGYLLYSACISILVYPIFGAWAWGSLLDGMGWLENLGFMDFAGSTVVHSVGGWAGLAGAIVLGPRLGKFSRNGGSRVIPGHNLPLAALGVFILWFGWFGFNPGSTTAGTDLSIAKIAVNTNLAAAAGGLAAMITAWFMYGKPDCGMSLNGALAGLVGITAGCAYVSPAGAVAIGLIAGALVVFSVIFFEKIRVDDPVGAISVHGVCGAWGTLAVAFFDTTGAASFLVQLYGVLACFAWTFIVAFAIFSIIKAVGLLRVTPEEEAEGLDIGEHGASAYPDFTISYLK